MNVLFKFKTDFLFKFLMSGFPESRIIMENLQSTNLSETNKVAYNELNNTKQEDREKKRSNLQELLKKTHTQRNAYKQGCRARWGSMNKCTLTNNIIFFVLLKCDFR